ncbi:MAG: NlpC/P60 family protein [Clostridium sp.]
MGKSRIRKRLISIAIIGIIALNTSMPVMATPNDEVTKPTEETVKPNEETAIPNGEVIENQDKYKELSKKIEEIQGEVYRLNTEMEKIAEVIKKNDEDMKVVSKDVEKLKKEIEQAQKDLLEEEEVLAKRLREMYKSGGQNNYVLMLLTSDGITDLVSKFYAASKMVDLDKKVISDLKDNQKELEKIMKELEKKSESIARATESNKKALEEMEKKKMEQELLITQMLVEQGKFDDEYLAVSEKKVVESQLKILRESTSLEELQVVIGQLINIRDKQLKSPIVIQEINKSIIEVTKRVEGLEAYLKEKGTNIEEGTLSGSAIVSYAYQFIGKPYVFGATGPDEFDCSGFTSYVYKNTVGVDITRTTYTQIKQGKSIPLSELQLGDLVFTYGVDHVGIYVGGGSYIHAPQPGESIKVSQITSFTEGRRIIEN